MKSVWGVVAVLLCISLSAGCFPAMAEPSVSSAPIFVSVPEDANPDVIWVVRAVKVSDGTFYGLFACYRTPAAAGSIAPPKCYLSEIAGDESALSWPAPVHVDGQGVVRPIR